MRIEDMATWTVDQLKEEVVRLADESEAKQHEILDKNEKINELQAELDNMCAYNNELKKTGGRKDRYTILRRIYRNRKISQTASVRLHHNQSASDRIGRNGRSICTTKKDSWVELIWA